MESKRLIVVEGPNGTGKTSLAHAIADDLGALYVHCGPFVNVSYGIGRLYVEAMLPAVLGAYNVVMDRSWISEFTYGPIVRDTTRLTQIDNRMLSRLAMRCGGVAINCFLDRNELRKNFAPSLVVDNFDQLMAIGELYRDFNFQLPNVSYNYQIDSYDVIREAVNIVSAPRQPVSVFSAGSSFGRLAIVVDGPGEHENMDSFYQWPMVSFSSFGPSRPFTSMLESAGIPEMNIFWVGVDEPLDVFSWDQFKQVLIIGKSTERKFVNKVPGVSYSVITNIMNSGFTSAASSIRTTLSAIKRGLNNG